MANIKFTATKTLIAYDLYNNDISASEIASASGGVLASEIMVDGITYPLPCTLLVSSYDESVSRLKFNEALQIAKLLKPASRAKLKNLFVAEIFSKSGYIQHCETPALEALLGINT